jgi:hypothetical protein
MAACQLAADVRFLSLGVSACCSAAAWSAAAIAGLVLKLGYAAMGMGRPAAAACTTRTLDGRDCGYCTKQIYVT